MQTRSKRKIEKALCKKGFIEQQGDHNFFIYYTLDGRKTGIFTKTSHTPHMKDISGELLNKMASQCKLSKDEFCRLVDCPLSRASYEAILKSNHGL
ncbi:MAG: type II toxin-antitoxin system HicA family toxin [Victivallales bacterium]|nr:type II toxin-antitoxin system HicA family toxin [Victivallales bacterium]